MMDNDNKTDSPLRAFAGQTASRRFLYAEIADNDGEPLIVAKVIQPFPDDFREDFDTDTGKFPGGSWEVMPHKDQEEGERPRGGLFRAQAYSLEYALLLSVALTSLLEASGQMEDLKDRVTLMRSSGDDIKDVTVREAMAETNPDGTQTVEVA